MKNQNDLIVIGVSILLSIGFALFFFFTQRVPVAPAAPTQVITTTPVYPTNTQPAMAASLPGGGGGGGAVGGMGGGMGMGMGATGMGGRMGGPPPGMGGAGGSRMGGGPKLGMSGGAKGGG